MTYQIKKLGEICDFQGGSQPPKSNFIFEQRKDYIRFLQIRDFKSEKNITYIPVSKKNKICKEDDVLIGRYGASVGKILTGLSGAYNVALMKTIPNLKILDKNFLYYYLKSNSFQEQLIRVSERSAQNGFSKEDIYNFPIPLYSLSEQKRIVDKLQTTFAEINNSINLANTGLDYSLKLEKNLVDEMVNNIDKKYLKKFEELCDFVRGPFGGSLKKSMFKEKGYAVYEQRHAIHNQFLKIRYFIDEKKFNEMKRFELIPGDLIMSCSGVTLGKIAIVPNKIVKGIINQALLKITPKKIILKEYLKIIMTSDYFQSILWNVSGGAAQPNVPSIKTIKNFLVPLIPISEQIKFIKKINDINQIQLNEIYFRKLSNLDLLKKNIFPHILKLNLTNSKK